MALHASGLDPRDGHTLATIIPATEETIEVTLSKVAADAGYRGNNAPKAVEPVIGHLKNDHRMGRNFLAFSAGDFNNAVLAAVG